MAVVSSAPVKLNFRAFWAIKPLASCCLRKSSWAVVTSLLTNDAQFWSLATYPCCHCVAPTASARSSVNSKYCSAALIAASCLTYRTDYSPTPCLGSTQASNAFRSLSKDPAQNYPAPTSSPGSSTSWTVASLESTNSHRAAQIELLRLMR